MNPSKKFLYNHAFILLLLFIFTYIVITYIYLQANTVPPRWDDSMYLEHSQIIFNAIQGRASYNPAYFNITTLGKFNLLTLYFHLLGGGHAPLITLLPVPSYFAFGTGFPGVAVTLLSLILAFNLIFYRFISETEDNPTALLAVVITSTMPLTVGLSRYFLVEYGLMTLVTLWVFLQINSDHFKKRHLNIWMGVVLGLGMLMKVTFPLYIIGPIVWGFMSVIVETKIDKVNFLNMLRNGLVVLLVGVLIMGTWYFPNIKSVLTFAFNAGFGGPAQDYSMGNPFAVSVLLNYWLNVINGGISAYYFIILVTFFAIQGLMYLFDKKRSASWSADKPNTPLLWIMLSWILVPLLVFSLGVNKDIRFLLPIFPPIGFIIAWLMKRLLYKKDFGKVAIALLIAFPCFMFGYISLPLSLNYSLHAGPFLMIAPQINYATRPVNQVWPLEQMLLTIEEDAKKTNLTNGNSPIFIGVVPNYEYFNPNNLGYYSAYHNLPFAIELFKSPINDDWTVQKDRILSKDYLITKTGNQGPSFAYNPYLTPLLVDGELPFKELALFKLPDGSEGIIYKNSLLEKKYPSILRFIRNISIGDQFGSLKLVNQKILFIHPGLSTPTQFEFDAAAFLREKGDQIIKITGAIY